MLGARSPSPTPGPPAQDSSARKISPHNFWLQKPVGIESVEETAGFLSIPNKDMHTDLLRLTPCDLQQWDSSLKGTSGMEGETEVSGIMVNRGHCPFVKPSHNRVSKLVPYLRFHQPG